MENRTKVTGICSLTYYDLKTIDGGNACGPMGPSRYNSGAMRCFRRCMNNACDWIHGFFDGFVGD